MTISTARRATNLLLRTDLMEDAQQLGINLSRACEAGLAEHIREAKAKRWLTENRAALESSNAWVEANGVPLAAHRMF